jgi:hypothetical protein
LDGLNDDHAYRASPVISIKQKIPMQTYRARLASA